MATQHEGLCVKMAEVDATFHEIFSGISSADLFRLIPWCISTASSPDVIPAHHLREALATTMQPGADTSVVVSAPGSEDSQALAPMISPAFQSKVPSPPILPLSDVPYISMAQVRCSLVRSLIYPQHANQDPFPNSAPNDQPGKRVHAEAPKAKAKSGYSTLQGGKELPKYHWKHMTMMWDPLTAPKSTTVGTALIMVVMNQPRMNQEWMQPTLIWNQPKGIV